MFTLRCLVDNNSSDFTRYQTEHGLALAIETSSGQILFDTGQSGEVLLHNAAVSGFDLRKVDALILSHAHYDHTGGLDAVLPISRSDLPLYAHPDLFCKRYAIKDGQLCSIGLHMAQSDLAKHTVLNLSAEPVQVLPGVWTTGEITIRTEFEGRSAHHYIQGESGWQPDPYKDDLALVLEMNRGLILVCGCCHAGLLNTLTHVRRIFNNKEIIAIVGGTHLSSLDKNSLERAINLLRATSAGDVPHLFLNHCTGEGALVALTHAFGEKVRSCPAGTLLRFE